MKKHLFHYINDLSEASSTLLFICVPLILAVLLPATALLAAEIESDPVYACFVYPSYFEHVMMSLVLAVGGAVLLDINEKR